MIYNTKFTQKEVSFLNRMQLKMQVAVMQKGEADLDILQDVGVSKNLWVNILNSYSHPHILFRQYDFIGFLVESFTYMS